MRRRKKRTTECDNHPEKMNPYAFERCRVLAETLRVFFFTEMSDHLVPTWRNICKESKPTILRTQSPDVLGMTPAEWQ